MAELPIAEFLRERLKEYDSKFEVRKGTAFDTLVFKPHQFMLQPFRDEADKLFIGQSFRRILQTEDPDAFDEELVDDLASNVFVTRFPGNQASGVARVYYNFAVQREFPANGFTVTGSNGKNYFNPAVFSITAAQMSSQSEGGLYYLDIPILAEEQGEDYNLDIDNLVTVIGDTEVISVTNKAKIKDGIGRETNTKLIKRCQDSISVRDLVTGKGFNATLLENFPNTITEIQAIGLGDPEMMRDILFNCHIGGKHDGYLKTPSVTTKSSDFLGVLIDTTRSTWTTTQLELSLTTWAYLGESSIDRTKGLPIVSQVKAATSASYTSTVNMSSPINLAGSERIKITIDGGSPRIIYVAGTNPTQTQRSEIINSINNAFGVNVAFVYANTIKLVSPTQGKTSSIVLEDPGVPYGSALTPVFGLSVASLFEGDGPIVFQEALHYEVNDLDGEIRRIIPAAFIVEQSATSTGTILGSVSPSDIVEADDIISPSLFALVEENDILTIVTGTYAGDYRVVEKIDNYHLRLDAFFSVDLVITDNYFIKRTGIKDGELVYVEYYFNPLSVDIGKYIKLDDLGRTRGIRPGREEYTITDVPFLKINTIEVIDPVSGEPTGEVLNGDGGYGLGGYGLGAYGIGASAQYRLITNEPTARFSAFEDSYIVFNSAYQGYSFRITYECTPELEDVHNFCRSDSERVLDGDILIKHFIPAYVSTTIYYTTDDTDSSIPDNDSLTELVKGFIDDRPAGAPLDVSDISQFILKNIDPYFRYTSVVKPFTLLASIHNTDGTTTMVESDSVLQIPTPDPFPKYTEAPISARTCHWMAGDITLVRS